MQSPLLNSVRPTAMDEARGLDFEFGLHNVPSMKTAKTITLRLSPEAYETAANLASQRHQSLNRLFQDGLLLLDQRERESRLFDDFSAIAAADEAEVEFALDAQVQAIAAHP